MALPAGSVYTLRIKKKFLNEIKDGEKTVEYRTVKPFYARLAEGSIQYIRLHYQRRERLTVEVRSIRVINTPVHLKSTGIDFGPRVYAIALGRIVEHVA